MGKNCLKDVCGVNQDFVLIPLQPSDGQLNSNLGVTHSSEIRVGQTLASVRGIVHFQVQ